MGLRLRHDQCFATLELTHKEYEVVRTAGARFLVKPEDLHVFPEIENVVARHERYWVVEKIGVAAEAAMGRNPRGD